MCDFLPFLSTRPWRTREITKHVNCVLATLNERAGTQCGGADDSSFPLKISSRVFCCVCGPLQNHRTNEPWWQKENKKNRNIYKEKKNVFVLSIFFKLKVFWALTVFTSCFLIMLCLREAEINHLSQHVIMCNMSSCNVFVAWTYYHIIIHVCLHTHTRSSVVKFAYYKTGRV